MKTYRMLLLADTHGQHRNVELPDDIEDFDFLIHAGDICKSIGVTESSVLQRNVIELVDFAAWIEEIPVKHKIVIAGNHDFLFEQMPPEARFLIRNVKKKGQRVQTGVTYLEHESVKIDGLKFFGSPWTPVFGNMAFNYTPRQARRLWNTIPKNTDVLITHGPPKGVGDRVWRYSPDGRKKSEHVGCKTLRERVQQVQPALHVFGHVHVGRGNHVFEDTSFYNAAMVNSRHEMTIPRAFEIEVVKDGRETTVTTCFTGRGERVARLGGVPGGAGDKQPPCAY